MGKSKAELIARQNEINTQLGQMESRELNAEETAQRESLLREWEQNKREIETINLAAQGKQEQEREFVLTAALRESRYNKKELNLREAITASGLAGKAVDVELQNILEPLYAKSVLAQLGVRWYRGLPMGDISIPVMGKGSAYWVSETGNNQDGTPSFGNNIVLKPHRLTTFFEISEQMLLQDTIGVNAAIQRDAINALTEKLESTIFGNEAGSDNKPAGIFYGKELPLVDTFAKLVNKEADIDDANVYGNLVYLLSNKAKADLRCMKKGGQDGNVMVGGAVDGTSAIATSLIAKANKAPFIYGDFSNLAVADWGNLIFKVDDSIAYANGKIRIYVSMYVDAKVLRDAAFVFGTTRDAEAPTITGATAVAAAKTAGNSTRQYHSSDGSAISAAVEESAAAWLTATVLANEQVKFTWLANDGESAAQRTGNVTLTTATGASLEVTVTQAANA